MAGRCRARATAAATVLLLRDGAVRPGDLAAAPGAEDGVRAGHVGVPRRRGRPGRRRRCPVGYRRCGRRAVRRVGRAGRRCCCGPRSGRSPRRPASALPPAALQPWARWITPEAEPRRYDTYFFVAALPPVGAPAAVDRRGLACRLDPGRAGAGRVRAGRAADAAADRVQPDARSPTSARRPRCWPRRRPGAIRADHADAAQATPTAAGWPTWATAALLPLPAGFVTASGKQLP